MKAKKLFCFLLTCVCLSCLTTAIAASPQKTGKWIENLEELAFVRKAQRLQERIEEVKETALKVKASERLIQVIEEAESKLGKIVTQPTEKRQKPPEFEGVISEVISTIKKEKLPSETVQGLINAVLNLELFAILKFEKGNFILRSFVLYDEELIKDATSQIRLELPPGWMATLSSEEDEFKEFLLSPPPLRAFGSYVVEVKGKISWPWGEAEISRDFQWKNASLVDLKVIGVFDNTENKGMDIAYASEKNILRGIDFSEVYQGKGGVTVGWRDVEKESISSRGGTYFVDLKNEFESLNFPTDNTISYACTYIHSDETRDVRFDLGSDDGCVFWLNGQEIHRYCEPRGLRIGEDKILAQLKEGWNEVLLKIGQVGGGWEFCLQIFNLEGEPIEELRCSTDKILSPPTDE